MSFMIDHAFCSASGASTWGSATCYRKTEAAVDPLGATLEASTANLASLLQQVENSQRQINDAIAVYDGCENNEEQVRLAQLEGHAAEVERCHATLAQLRTAETQQCDTAEDCLCDEARLATTGQEELCEAKTETYEVAFCGHRSMCTTSHSCLATAAGVYQLERADVEAKMELVVQQYTANERIKCMASLHTGAYGPTASSEMHEQAMDACREGRDVDVSALAITYPEEPTQPAACPAHTHGNPPCAIQID